MHPSSLAFAFGVALAAGLVSGARAQDVPPVVVSIAPIHSLAVQVMDGVGQPRLLLRPGVSEHTVGLKPSDAKALANARLVVWVGPMLETPLAKPIASLARNARVIELVRADGLAVLAGRGGGTWEAHDDGDGHVDEDGHARAEGRNIDGHIWLDPGNAKVIVRAIAHALAEADPAHAGRYRANAAKAVAAIAAMDDELAAKLAPVKGVPFVVFHDAYQYFERHYGLRAVGSVTISPDRAPGAQRLIALRAKIRETGAACVFAEPQFEPRLVATLIEGTDARTGVLDPLGAALVPGAGQYGQLMRGLADALVKCLSGR